MGGTRGASPRGQAVVRPRLLDALNGRFRARLTTVVGAAGSGKTTLLAQALEHPGDDVDVWYPCTPPDHDADRFLRSVVVATADQLDDYRPPEAADPLAGLSDLVLAASPHQVCIMLDDVHVLRGAAGITDLLNSMPRNGHLLVAGRSLPGLDVARLDALGELVTVGQHELMMTPEELVEFATRRGIDVERLDGADGWPAFVELASSGVSTRPREFLEQEALTGLADERRAALASFAFVGGGNDELARAVTGEPIEQLLDGLPLVRWSGDVAQLHDLWVELLSDWLPAEKRHEVALAAADVLLARRDFEQAILLGTSVDDWGLVTRSLGAAIREGADHGIRASQFERWTNALPPDVLNSPIGKLVQGIVERERDATAERTATLLTEAADGFRVEGDPELQLVAALQLGYAARWSGRPELMFTVGEQVAELAEHYPPARPYLAFGEAWVAMAKGNSEAQLAAMESVIDSDLTPVWALSRDHMIAYALVELGRADEALDWAPSAAESAAMPIPGGLMTRSQCLWHSGQPALALAEAGVGTGSAYGARDRFIGGAWSATMLAFTGDVGAAVSAAGIARSHAGALPADVVNVQLMGVDLLITLVGGDEQRAADELAAILEFVPLGEGFSEQLLRTRLAIPYVLVESSREFWDAADLGPLLRVARLVAQAFVAARSGDMSRLTDLAYPEPGLVASNLPAPWAVEFGLYSILAGRPEGRRLIGWLCEHWGDPARETLRRFTDHPRLGQVAQDVLAQTPVPPAQQFKINLLGTSTVTINGYETSDPDWRRERVRALLAWLVVHRHGTRDQLLGALWPELPAAKGNKNLRTTLSYLHKLLEPRRSSRDATWFVQTDGPNVRLNPQTEVDVWRFTELLDAADAEQRSGRTSASLPLILDALAEYGGGLASDLDYQWLDLERIHLQSRFVRASCRAGELLTATGRHAEAIEVLRHSLATDQFHEASYVALAEAYTALGDTTSAQRIRDLATSQMGDLVDPRQHSTR